MEYDENVIAMLKAVPPSCTEQKRVTDEELAGVLESWVSDSLPARMAAELRDLRATTGADTEVERIATCAVELGAQSALAIQSVAREQDAALQVAYVEIKKLKAEVEQLRKRLDIRIDERDEALAQLTDLRAATVAPALVQGMARAEAWKGKSTAEICETLTRQWEALAAHGGEPETTSGVPRGAILSPVQTALNHVRGRVPESVYLGLSAVILGAHREAVALQESERCALAERERLANELLATRRLAESRQSQAELSARQLQAAVEEADKLTEYLAVQAQATSAMVRARNGSRNALSLSIGARVRATARADGIPGRIEGSEGGRWLVLHDDGSRVWWEAGDLKLTDDNAAHMARITEMVKKP